MRVTLAAGHFTPSIGRINLRVLKRLVSQDQMLVYACDLRSPPIATVGATVPVTFQVNSKEGLAQLAAGDPRFELSAQDLMEIPAQTAQGEVCVTGWVDGDLTSYGWMQFRQRRLAGSTQLPIGPKRAFIYRSATVKDYRGHGIYTAALVFCQLWLRDRAYERVFIDTDATNRASRKAIDRAGFELISSYWVHRLLGKRWATYPESLRQALVDDGPLRHGQ